MLRSFFISSYALFLFIAGSWSLFHLVFRAADLSSYGALVSIFTTALYFWFIEYNKPSQMGNAGLIVSTLLWTSLLVVAGNSFLNHSTNTAAIWIALANASAYMGYGFWYTKAPKNSCARLEKGQSPPEEVLNLLKNGETTSIKRSKLLVFHRADCNSFCEAQIRDLLISLPDFEKIACEIHFISLNRLAQTSPNNGLVYHHIDKDALASKKLGIYSPNICAFLLRLRSNNQHSLFPATILLDKQNLIVYGQPIQDYRNRPSVEFYLRFLKQ